MKKYAYAIIAGIVAVISSCRGVYEHPDFGRGYTLVSDGEYTLALVDAKNDVLIPTHILDYAFDSTFILVAQRPWDIPGVEGLDNMTYNQRDETFKNSKFCQYWIINKKEKEEDVLDTLGRYIASSNVYGPFTKDMYLQKRKELNVPDSLNLKWKE